MSISFESISDMIGKDVYFLYNNFKNPDSSIIDTAFEKTVYKAINGNKARDEALVVLHTAKGKLTCGKKIAQYFREGYGSVDYYIPERCGEAGTLIALTGNHLSYERDSMITPCDPLMRNKDDKVVPTFFARNLIEKGYQYDSTTLENYYASTGEFKSISKKLFSEEQSKAVNSLMLDSINNHYTPLDDEDFKDMGVSITTIDPEHIAKLKEVHDFIKNKQSRSTWPFRNTIRYYDSCILGTQSGYIFQCDYNDSTDMSKRYEYVPRHSTRYEVD